MAFTKQSFDLMGESNYAQNGCWGRRCETEISFWVSWLWREYKLQTIHTSQSQMIFLITFF